MGIKSLQNVYSSCDFGDSFCIVFLIKFCQHYVPTDLMRFGPFQKLFYFWSDFENSVFIGILMKIPSSVFQTNF